MEAPPPPAIVLPDGSPEQFVDGTVYSFDYNSGDSTTLASFTNCDFTGTLYSLADRPLTFKQYRGNIFIFSCSFTNTSVGDYKGGAVFIAKSLNYNTNPVTVEFCNFTDCTSYSSGAGMNMEDIAFVTVTKCRYVRCSNYRESSDSSGGGLWIYFSTSSSQSSTVSDLYFEECTTAQTAGGLYLSFVRNIHVIASLSFKGCSAISPIYRGSAGAMYIEGVSLAKHDISASHLKFEDCSAYREAGGLKSHLEESSLFLTDCEFVRCSSADSEMYKVLGGGGLYAYGYGAKITLKGCRFNECSSTTLGGAVFVEVSGLEMSDCLVQNCSSKTSGAVCIVPRSAVPITLTNTLFIENAVSDTPTYFNRHESMKDAVQFADFLIEDLEESYPTDVTIRDCWTTTTPNSVGMYSARYDPETFEQLSYERVVMDAFLGMGPLLTQKVEAFLDIESLRIDLVVKGKVPLESQEYEVTVAENEGGAEMTGHLKLSGGTGTLVLPSKDTLKFNTGYTITKIVAVVDPSSSSLMTNDITIPQEAWAFNLDANPSFATFTTPKIPPILKASCRAGSGTDHVWIQLTGLNITAGTYSVTLEGLEFSFPVRFTDGSDVISQVLSSEASIRLFGDGSKLTFGTEYTLKSVTDTSTSTPLDLCGLIITFTTPQATDRIVGIGTMGFTNSQKDEVSVSLSGSDLVSTEYFIETSPPSVLNGNKLSVTFTDQSGTLVGKVYSAFGNAVPLKFGETYEIVSVTRTNNQPILFVALTFSVPNEPARIESTSCTLNGPKTAVIVTLNGRQLLSAAMSVKLKNSTTNRFFMSNLLFVNTTSCTVSFPTAQTETNSALVFGGTYNVVSVESSDGKSSFVVNTGVNVSVPSAPIITSISSSLSPNCSHFEISFSGTSLPSTGSFVASISPSITLALRYVNGLWTTGWLTDGYVGMKLNTSYTVTQVADGENEMILNKDTFTTALGPTLSSIPIVTLKTGDLNSVVLSLDGLRMPVSSVVPSFDLIVVESGKTTEDISIPVSFSTNEVGSGEVEVYKSGKLKYSTSYSVVRMTSTAVSVSIPSAVIFSTPAAPTRIISAECNLDSETEKSAEIVLTGVSFPQSTPGSS
ncbi:hypothetical protein BLNAU_14773 [Blattamonas nauphoetae]|uniref:Right handed beta helix domain-containing protein n=1 Tax=Blattamonas nauphoetae TaxID=2049346 RepID=A0ABQ9XE96_9EUKA|nr:hypothetical protein BLNAU_14773 [Blattamonas nauphoetae]